ncbi:MAG: hypothetical protein C4326_12840 [Ignavibacteria bacterium]
MLHKGTKDYPVSKREEKEKPTTNVIGFGGGQQSTPVTLLLPSPVRHNALDCELQTNEDCQTLKPMCEQNH